MMRFRTVPVHMLALGVLVLGGLGCADPAADKPQAEVREAAAVPAPSVETTMAATTFTIVPEESSINFVGSKVTGSHDGGFNEFSGTIGLVGNDPTKSSVDLTIDTSSIWSDNERLTGHLKSPDFFDVEAHPQARFVSTSIVPQGEQYLVTGNLTLHGITKSVTFPAKIEMTPDEVSANAEFAIKRFDFEMEYPGKADDLIRDDVVVRFDLVARRGAPGMDVDAGEAAVAQPHGG
jgi:polyisoprenoid-binding protein YceI